MKSSVEPIISKFYSKNKSKSVSVQDPTIRPIRINIGIIIILVSKNKQKSECINSSTKDIYKKYSEHFQDPTRDIVLPIV